MALMKLSEQVWQTRDRLNELVEFLTVHQTYLNGNDWHTAESALFRASQALVDALAKIKRRHTTVNEKGTQGA